MIDVTAMHSIFALNQLRTEKQKKINRFSGKPSFQKPPFVSRQLIYSQGQISPEIDNHCRDKVRSKHRTFLVSGYGILLLLFKFELKMTHSWTEQIKKFQSFK